MRVLHGLCGLHAAGIEALALQLIRHAPAGVHHELLNADRSEQQMVQAFQQLLDAGQLAAIHQWPRCDGPELAWRSFQLCRRRRPDALLIYPCNRMMLWLALGARLAGVRRLAVHLGNTAPATATGRRLWHRLLVWFQRLGVEAVPCSEAIVASLQPLPTGTVLGPVIPNGCDLAAIGARAAATRAQRMANDLRRVLMVARLDPIKDQATLLRAFAAARLPGWEMQLVGDGPDRPRLEALAQELGLDPAQVLLGSRADVPELLGQADLFAFSTTPAEGFGIALIEALAAGLPVIASDVPACREVLRDGAAGELLPAADLQGWSARLEELMASAQQRQALANRSVAQATRYDIRRTAERWYGLLSPQGQTPTTTGAMNNSQTNDHNNMRQQLRILLEKNSWSQRILDLARFTRSIPSLYRQYQCSQQQSKRGWEPNRIFIEYKGSFLPIYSPEDLGSTEDLDKGGYLRTYNLFCHHATAWYMRKEVINFIRFALPAKRFADVGAAEGFYSALFASMHGSEAEILSVDCGSEAGCDPRHLVITQRLNSKHFNPRRWDLSKSFVTGSDLQHPNFPLPHDCKITTLPDLLNASDFVPDLIKFDIESSEYEVLLQSHDWLKAHRPTLIIEIHNDFLKPKGLNFKTVLNSLGELGYRVVAFDDKDYLNAGNCHVVLEPAPVS